MLCAYIGVSIAKQLKAILDHFRISEKFGYAIANNAFENTACLNYLSELLHIDLDKRRVMCIGHVINLVAQECLFGSDVEAFEEEIQDAMAEEYDAAARAVKLRVAIEEFIDHELGDYYAAMARYSEGRSQGCKALKAPKLLDDVLDADYWSVISYSESPNATTAAEEQILEPDEAEVFDFNPHVESQKHFLTNINSSWQKLDVYFNKTDAIPIYRAAVGTKPQWLAKARTAVNALWAEYKDCSPIYDSTTFISSSPTTTVYDEWSSHHDSNNKVDQLEAYLAEPYALIHPDQSPIPYWISKLAIWPQLAKMTLDIYSTLACSDELERIFSEGGNLLNARRRQMTGDHVQEVLCLRSWQASGIVTLDTEFFKLAISQGDYNNTSDDDDEVLYRRHRQQQAEVSSDKQW
ncbi:hypothetical protein Q7P35_005507 [Cladosporium inversicolor]